MNNEYSTLCMSCAGSCKQLAAATVIDCPKYDYNNTPLPTYQPKKQSYRELTSPEKKGIKELVTTMCANYDNHYKECLLLDTACPMLLKHYHNGKLCKYFENAVLPLDKGLEISLANQKSKAKKCSACGSPFLPKGRQAYCSENCRIEGKKKANAKHMRKTRQ